MSTTRTTENTVPMIDPADVYAVPSRLAEHLYQSARTWDPEARAADHFLAKRTTHDTRNPVRVIPREGGGYDVALIVGGIRPTAEDANAEANFVRQTLTLAWLDLYGRTSGDTTAAAVAEEEVRRYEDWRIVPADDETDEEIAR